eukprot:s1978_g5.t2
MSAAPVPVAESAQYQSPGFSAAIPETPLSPAPGTPDWTALPPQQPPPAGVLRDEAPAENSDVQHYEHHEHNEHYEHHEHNEPTLVDTTQERVPEPSAENSDVQHYEHHEHNEHYEHHEHNEPTLVDTTQERVPEPSPPQLPLEVPPPPSVQSDAQESQGSEGNLLPQKRPAAALVNTFLANYDVHDNGEITLKDHDTTENNQVPFQRNYYYGCYLASSTRKDELAKAGVLEEPQREDETTDDESLTASNDRTRSRQEAKQLDREIPWRQLTELPRPQYEEYLQATRVENDNWMSWGGIQPISHREAKRITGDLSTARRILRARAAYRDKSKGVGQLRPKCRVVIIGCQDPDIFNITRDSPTPTRLSETLLMTIAAAGANRSVCGSNKQWHLWVSDAKSAFLQGDQDASERNGPLYMRPPRDPLITETNSFPAELYMVTGNCYGLPNAPRVWYLRVHRAMTEQGFQRHTFDRCMYYYLDPATRELQAVVIIHVDDFLAAYNSSFPLHILENLFVWGSVTKVTTEQGATYRGKEITLKETNGRYRYYVTQKSFIDGMEGGRIPRGRGQQAESLTAQEWADFRSVAGSLQWLAGQCRPEIGPIVSLSNRGKETSYKDLHRLFETVDWLKRTSSRGLVYQDLAVNQESVFVTYTDSSFANADLKSQFGVCVFLSSPQVTRQPTPGTLVDWRSARSTRICRSTLAAEASAADEGADRAVFANMCLGEIVFGESALKGTTCRSTLAAEASAADEGADRAVFANMCLGEIVFGESALKGTTRFDNIQVSDAKSLYDTVVAENPSVSDKRSLINIRSIQQSVKPKDFRWVPTEHMVADGLTKLDWKLTEQMSVFLQDPVLVQWGQLMDCPFTFSGQEAPGTLSFEPPPRYAAPEMCAFPGKCGLESDMFAMGLLTRWREERERRAGVEFGALRKKPSMDVPRFSGKRPPEKGDEGSSNSSEAQEAPIGLLARLRPRRQV